MVKLLKPLNWSRMICNIADIMSSKSRLRSCSLYSLAIYLCLLATSSPLWCTSSVAQLPAASPLPGLTPAPSPSLAPNGSATDPDQMAAIYSLPWWPDVWRFRGTVPNISDITAPNRDPCISHWVGVYCDGGFPYQFILNITIVDVRGGFPPNFLIAMSKLKTLQFLRIYQKGDKATSSLGGTIPASLGQLQELQEINFWGNQLVGGVPVDVALLPKLTSINLADNHLTGPIAHLCQSKSLQTILLFDNQFTSDIPACLGSMNLTNLNLGANNITGGIPPSFSNLVNMETLNLDNTTLVGGLPNAMVAKWPRLTSLSIRRSNLSGPIPPAIGSLKLLTLVNLAQNNLSGPIPATFGNLDSVVTLGLYENKLTGTIPPELGNMKNLTNLLLSENSLSGPIPASLGKLSKLQQLHLQGNKLSGAVNSQMFLNFTGLKGLFLQMNNFSGVFPSHGIFNSCMSLVNVSISNNFFSGPVLEPNTTLPTNLTFLLMSNNHFSGAIPAAMGDPTISLQYLDLSSNSLSGEVPTQVTGKARVAQINLSFNTLKVTKLPSKPGFGLFNCLPEDNNCIENQRGHTEEVAINVGGPEYHEYEADIPTSDYSIEMYTNSSTSVWSMSTRGIDGGGVINGSQTLSNAESIDSWPLYNTARTGADSFQYYIHSLVPAKYKVALGFVELNTDVRPGDRIFDIWIQGKLVYQGMDVMVHAGAGGLLSIELRGRGSWPLVLNKRFKQGFYYGPTLSSLRVYRPKELSRLAKIGIIVGATAGGVLLAAVFLLIGFCYIKRKQREKELREEQSSLGLMFFRYSELEAATNKWSSKNLLGEGAFGKVYRGVLSDGTIVAIKQLITKKVGPMCSKESFLNEARIISTTRHRNLIALLGCCFETENAMFVCEYMPNGSLHDVLFVREISLDWAQRMTIAKDVANGLRCLHEETVNRIIHRDVKPANILLDEKMSARVADFGLARLVADQEIDVVTNVMGTRGYLAPEYALNGHLSDKVDVYSYGVVLLELISGRHGMQLSEDAEPIGISMVHWIWDMVEAGKVLTIADPTLDHRFYNEDFIRMVEIGLWCTQSHPHMRPSMNQREARVPKLVEQRTMYETRDTKGLPVNPFDEMEWPSYVAEVPTLGLKEEKNNGDTAKMRSDDTQGSSTTPSFDNSISQVSGVTPR
uniref:Protein kinase domain-containing protein n=1 Tax=Physcomitrium patens TaxID=3218 RepID=A0A2K1IX75_PHYPA|nr:hypothetical protein PHYPA_023687 [Physcomitrium patens]